MKLDKNILLIGRDSPYNGYEDDMQQAIATYLFYQHSKSLWYHVPNGGKRNAREANKFRKMGVRPGVADLLVDEPLNGYHGLRIELKTGKNKPTARQEDFLNKANDRGYLCAVCWNINETKQLIEDYFNGLYTKTEEEKLPAQS